MSPPYLRNVKSTRPLVSLVASAACLTAAHSSLHGGALRPSARLWFRSLVIRGACLSAWALEQTVVHTERTRPQYIRQDAAATAPNRFERPTAPPAPAPAPALSTR